jgi:hypothetical protein
MSDLVSELLPEINKRFTMNLLIQGAATHSFLTTHHLVKDALDDLDPSIVELYDKMTVSAFLAYWYGDLILVGMSPKRFWRNVKQPTSPFAQHRLLANHGRELVAATFAHARRRAREKGVSNTPGIHYAQMMMLFARTRRAEAEHRAALVQLAKDAASQVWGLEVDRYEAELTADVEFGNLRTPETTKGKIFRAAAIGYGGVIRDGDQLKVMAKSLIWPLVCHELIKGTAELVCLHGLNKMSPETLEAVTKVTDGIELEVWLMQAGSELWRRLLSLIPPAVELPRVLMEIALLPPDEVERLMIGVAEQSAEARRWIARL